MSEPTNAELLARLDKIEALLADSRPAPARIEYSAKEFAGMVGMATETLRRREYYMRYGGKKRRGRIVFSEAARLAIAEGKK